MNSRVLIVDDEPNIRRMLTALLEQDEYEVRGVGQGNEAPDVVNSFEPAVVLLDLIMPPGPDGIATLEVLQR
ncbi:MAG: response regulator, partial [Gemmatimonadales bacterium]